MDPAARLLTIFAKHPTPGQVKTRLVPPLTPDEAARLAEAMLDDAVERFARGAAWTCALAVAPATRIDWFRARYPAVEVALQEGAGLGARMARWFGARCTPGRAVVVVGGDAPLLVAADVRAAFEALEEGADAVFVPDAGGGYALVGLRAPHARLFERVPMSTASMFDETLTLARGLGLTVRVLPARRDVDDAGDLARLARDLEALRAAGALAPDHPRHTAEVLRTLKLPAARA